MPDNLRLPFDEVPDDRPPRRDRDLDARAAAVDPRRNVVLEASAGTGKTSVLVTRYLNLLAAGVDPANILAITFTRKAAAEMRQRIVTRLREDAVLSPAHAARWHGLRERMGDIAISTIDAFCLSLLMEFPLEADLDPAFGVADETQVLRLTEESLERTLRRGRKLAAHDEPVALVFGLLGEGRLRAGLASLLGRRVAVSRLFRRALAANPGEVDASRICRVVSERLRACFDGVDERVEDFVASGPDDPRFVLLADDLRALTARDLELAPGRLRAALDGLRDYFLTASGTPRQRLAPFCKRTAFASEAAWRRHVQDVVALAPQVSRLLESFRADLNGVVAAGVWRLFRVARKEYARRLDAAGLVDFPDMLGRALGLLARMDEFSQSRYRLQARYHHLLIDEFQDTSRAQWRLVSLLVQSWGEGEGLAHESVLPPSIFVVGDRKQSIYGFRDADVTVLDTARRQIERLRSEGRVRRSIARSFRSVPELLAFANDLFRSIDKNPARRDAFRFGPSDRFPLDVPASSSGAGEALGLVLGDSVAACAQAVAAEIERLMAGGTVRDRTTGVRRAVRPGDIAILFRSRESHREFEQALAARSIPAYVYKGLGFFEADEVKDLVALLRYLAEPGSDVRAAALLRSRFVRLSDAALRILAPGLASALVTADPLPAGLDEEDRAVLERLRGSLGGWLALVDRVPPASVLDAVLTDSAYAYELRGPRHQQARENLKKMQSLVRRIQNRGYATMGRIAEHITRLSAGDESNAVVDALEAVNLMTVHAAKGLEFPVAFLVNLTRGAGGRQDPIRISACRKPGGNGGPVQPPLPAVSVGDFRSEADEDARSREQEETKRLLYVAVTRARDRLYLSMPAPGGRLKVGAGSLGDVLPVSLREWIGQVAGQSDGQAVWHGPRGHRHVFTVCRPPASGAGSSPPAGDVDERREGASDAVDLLDRLPECRGPIAPSCLPATAWLASVLEPESPGGDQAVAREEGAVLGTAVHHLVRACGLDARPVAAEALLSLARRLVEAEGRAERDIEALSARAVGMFLELRARPDVMAIAGEGESEYEVAFSLALETAGQRVLLGARAAVPLDVPVVLRGSIDWLVRKPDGSMVVVELKTGRPSYAHKAQLDLYCLAAERLFPGRRVQGVLVSASAPEPGTQPAHPNGRLIE